ncbi:MAG TPA: hypothetical protein VFU17_00135 [Candidatus Limnocylindrales bacterium]|nr:hypothetical protein [Candidatus Limnocylindrales bacterium]
MHLTVKVLPAVTSNVERVYPFHVLLPAAETGLDRDFRLNRSLDRGRAGG